MNPNHIVVVETSGTSVICSLLAGNDGVLYKATSKRYERIQDAKRDAEMMNAKDEAKTPEYVRLASGPKVLVSDSVLPLRHQRTASEAERRLLNDPTRRYTSAHDMTAPEAVEEFGRLPWAMIIEIPGGAFYSRSDLT